MTDLISRESVERMIKTSFADYVWERHSLLSKLENIHSVEAVPLTELKDKMLKYGFTAPDMTVTEFVEDFETL